MKIQILPRTTTLTNAQRVRLVRDLGSALARFGERIERVSVEVSGGELDGLKQCEIVVRLKPHIVKVEHSDTDVFRAMEHAAKRVARSVSRAIEIEGLVGR